MMNICSSLSSSHHLVTSPSLIVKVTSLSLLTLSVFFLFRYVSVSPLTPPQTNHLSFFNSTKNATLVTSPSPPPPPLPRLVVERTGIVNEMGIMTDDFVVGEFDESLIQSVVLNVNGSGDGMGKTESDDIKVIKVEKFKACDEGMVDFVPCMDNVERFPEFNSSENNGKRHCPERSKGLDCLVPRPKGYKSHISWPKSRDEVWFANVLHTSLVDDKGGQNWISRKDDKLIFQGDGTQFIHGAKQHLDQISEMVPDITFGKHIRVALDIGCGVGSFGAYLMERNVTTLSIAPKDAHENQIQLALERGVPAMIALFGTQRLPYPSQAFDLIHCYSCRINWARDDGILLLEVNRILRAGGYFVWPAQPMDKNEVEQWKEMEDLTRNLYWNLVKKEGHVAIWQKPLNNSCYLNRESQIKPPLCNIKDDPEDTWHVDLKACITRLLENGYGANITQWPARLHSPPDRLFTIQMDADKSRRELYKADSMYWNDILSGYIGAFRIHKANIRNVMDMKAGYGGFAAALIDHNVDCWVMNVVPVSGPNTLPLIYDRGLIGVRHDWCEPFDTYPRTYDWINAAGLFSIEMRRCNITNIMLEIDRMLRPSGRAYIQDTTIVIYELQEIAKAMGWVTFLFDSGEGPHSNRKLLVCEKRI